MTVLNTIPVIFSSFSSSSHHHHHHHLLQLSPLLFSPNFIQPIQNPRLRISFKAAVSSKKHNQCVLRCCGSNLGFNPDTIDDLPKESSVDMQLPRRSLLVQFTCNACGGKTKRLVNRLAYERGTVFVQCSECLQHHKLVDNLGLVVEYDFRNNNDDDKMHT